MGLRRERLADEVRDIIASCFQAGILGDPRLSSVTITGVKLSGDCQLANIYFTSHDPDVDKAKRGLMSASSFLRKKLADNLDIRRVPDLRFYHDESIERGAYMESLLKQI